MAQSPREVAESLYAAMPHGMSLDLLSEYGLEISPEQARHITRELLSLNLYWVHTALQSNLRQDDVERIWTKLEQRIQLEWKESHLQGHEHAAVFEEAKNKRAAYDQIVQEGGSPIAVFGESAASLEFSGTIETGDRQKLLALFIDLVPVDTFGELMDSLELAD
jgi:hypothetical protein